jgi:glycosyltransferase involved in cell wall biosynthesis
MRILYDGNIYSLQAAGGITRYFANLISRLPADFHPALVVGPPFDANYASHPHLKIYRYGKRRADQFSYRLSSQASEIEKSLLGNSLARRRFDVFHPTYYTLLTGQSMGDYRSPIVVTVWDMIDEIYAAEVDPSGQNARNKLAAINAADKIICISQNTKKDLLERYAVAENKIAVTYLASQIDATISHGSESVPERPYYLYVGSRASYKNFGGLLEAFAKVISVRPGFTLCVVGGPLTTAERDRIAELKLSAHVEHYGYPSDNHLAKLYRCSLALVYPTFYEGFGLPPLEAMSCGTVAVVANVSSLPEVVGKAGILFDPSRIDELVEILLRLPDDSARRESLIIAGQQHSREFSWDRTTAETIEVYRSAGQ